MTTYLVVKNSGVVHEFKTEEITWCGNTEWMQYGTYPFAFDTEDFRAAHKAHVSVLSYKPDMPMCGNCLKVKQRILKGRGIK